MFKTGAEILCECLIKEGVEVIFGFPGGVLLPLYDTLPRYPELRHILVRHEQGAAHAADAYARVTGKVGVCLATSGPGATNLVTGIANAHLDSVPMLAITGQVPTFFIGKDAFQEIDITGITLPITKYNHLIRETGQIATAVKESMYIARAGRPGPVLLDIPRDVLEGQAEFIFPEKIDLPGYKPKLFGHPAQIKKAAELINAAERPVIIAGHGVNISCAYAELKELAEKSQIPVVTTFLGVGCFPESHVLSYGWLGMHGMGYANKAVYNSDLLIAIGMRFDDRATGVLSSFAPHASIIHIDIDPAEIGKNLAVDVPIVGDVKNILQVMNSQINKREHMDWLSQLDKLRSMHPATEIREHEGLLPQYIIRQIYEITRGDTIVVTDVGQHQMWTGQYFFYDKPNSLISSGGLGAMGFGLPASIGAKVGAPHENVWCICGDGGFQMTVQELATMVQENLDINIAVFNNGWLGMVRQWQELIYQKRYFGTQLYNPDFVGIAKAYGIKGERVSKKIDVRPAIEKAMAHKGPYVIEFMIEPEENVYPFVPPGKTLVEFLELPHHAGSTKK